MGRGLNGKKIGEHIIEFDAIRIAKISDDIQAEIGSKNELVISGAAGEHIIAGFRVKIIIAGPAEKL